LDKNLSKQLVRELLMPLAAVSAVSALAAFWPLDLSTPRATISSVPLPVNGPAVPEGGMRSGSAAHDKPITVSSTGAPLRKNI
jgi:hypothetical protein